MRIAKQFSHFGVWFLCGHLQFSYEIQPEQKLVLLQCGSLRDDQAKIVCLDLGCVASELLLSRW
jgi:hypothetical protein